MPVPAAPALTVPAFEAPTAVGTLPTITSVGGVVPVRSLRDMQAEEQRRIQIENDAQQSQPVILGLAGHIRSFWHKAEEAKRTVQDEMIEAMYARRGKYTDAKLAQIKESNQPAIYMMVASAKMRQVEALVRDVMLGSGGDKPWTLEPTPSPDLPPEIADRIVSVLANEIELVLGAGVHVTMEDIRQRLRLHREQADARLLEEARVRCERMEVKMEDQLVEGGFLMALDQFITDLATFKTAFIKGPIVRKKPRLTWGRDGQLSVQDELVLHWERVDPFNIYPAPWARHISEGPLIEKHKLSRDQLSSLIGVEGYSEVAIRQVLAQYGESGLNSHLAVDSERAYAEGRSSSADQDSDLIDALQYWGSASGKMLIDWGLDPEQVPDTSKEYQIEAWLVGSYVIKAVLNADPLARRPYYSDSFQRVPGSVWGNAPYDLIRDCQDMCNATARSLAANLGISSGPQVGILSNRLAEGEDVTEMYPWKIWQFESDLLGSTAAPITFFQPTSNAQELMGVFDRFSLLADEYTGIPRYMAGFNEGAGGAGRTASGMSMMIGNASKIIKQVVGSMDTHVISPLLDRLYYYNMRYSDDADLKGDVRVVARGATSLALKEAAQIRLNEYLRATANPLDAQILGLDGRAELHRHVLKTLDVTPDKVVPPVAVLRERAALAQLSAMQQQMPGAPGNEQPQGPANGQTLMNGAPVTDNVAPTGQ